MSTPPMPDIATGVSLPPTVHSQRAASPASPPVAHGSQSPLCHNLPTEAESRNNPWEICLDYAKDHVHGETALWKDEVDKLLIFATLFSGVVGAFAIESYHNVRQDSTDTTALLLKSLLAHQLNITDPEPNPLKPVAQISSSEKRINIYNFLSLILSLSVVMAGILCLQWLREYGQDPSGFPGPRREQLGIRYMRREGMKRWHVFTILKMLPLMLLLALFLFFAGIIELLLGVDRTAAIWASIMIGFSTFFILITTALPTIQSLLVHFFPRFRLPECPYKSPQAWICYQAATAPIYYFKFLFSKFRGLSFMDDASDTSVLDLQNWSGYDWLVYSGHTRSPGALSNVAFGVHWLGRLYLQERQFAEALYQCIQDTSMHMPLRDILMVKKDTRRVGSSDRAWMWSPSVIDTQSTGTNPEMLKQAHVSDITVFQTLAHLAEKIERGHPPSVLLRQRLELFFRINHLRPDRDIDCPLINDADQRDLISYEVRRELLECICKLMKEDVGVNESHLAAVGHILELESDMPNPDTHLFDNALEVLQDWIDRQQWDPDGGDPESDSKTTRTKLQNRSIKLERSIHILRRLVTSRRQARGL